MKKSAQLRYYIESLCVYNVKEDEVIKSLLELLKNVDNEKVLELQSDFFQKVTRHKSLTDYISRLILTDDNAFTKAAAGRKTAV